MADQQRTRLGVAGWPIVHSRSPAMHNAALAAVGLSGWRYQLLPIPPKLFTETVRGLPAAGFRGINVTIPHKEAALALAGSASERAAAIGAANTLLFADDGSIYADNTDAPALIAALSRREIELADTSALVLGAGGSARAAVWALADAGVRDIRVYARTRARAERLCSELGGTVVDSVDPAQLLVHCTPVGLRASLDVSSSEELPIPADRIKDFRTVVDFVYRDQGSALVQAARDVAAATVDGLELLVGQGALSFEQFTGHRAPVGVMADAAASAEAAAA
jgi:shikimate dehydrogenase